MVVTQLAAYVDWLVGALCQVKHGSPECVRRRRLTYVAFVSRALWVSTDSGIIAVCWQRHRRKLTLMANLFLGDPHIPVTEWRLYRSGTGSWALRTVSRETDRHVRAGNAWAP